MVMHYFYYEKTSWVSYFMFISHLPVRTTEVSHHELIWRVLVILLTGLNFPLAGSRRLIQTATSISTCWKSEYPLLTIILSKGTATGYQSPIEGKGEEEAFSWTKPYTELTTRAEVHNSRCALQSPEALTHHDAWDYPRGFALIG